MPKLSKIQRMQLEKERKQGPHKVQKEQFRKDKKLVKYQERIRKEKQTWEKGMTASD